MHSPSGIWAPIPAVIQCQCIILNCIIFIIMTFLLIGKYLLLIAPIKVRERKMLIICHSEIHSGVGITDHIIGHLTSSLPLSHAADERTGDQIDKVTPRAARRRYYMF